MRSVGDLLESVMEMGYSHWKTKNGADFKHRTLYDLGVSQNFVGRFSFFVLLLFRFLAVSSVLQPS